MKPDPSEDRELLTALREGEDRALDRLIARWERPLFAFAWRYTGNAADSQDLVAETFVRLYQQRQRLRAGTNVSAWLFTTLSNLCHNRHRWKKRHPTVSMDGLAAGETGQEEMFEADTPHAAAILEQGELMEALRTALNNLPHDLKTALILHYFDRLSYREIAEITGCSERGIETRLYRARNRLRKELGPTWLEASERSNGPASVTL